MKIIKITNRLAIVINPKKMREIDLVTVNIDKEKFKEDVKYLHDKIKDNWNISQTWQFESGILYEIFHDVEIQ